MMRRLLLLVSLCLASKGWAGDLPGFVLYRASDLKAYSTKLAAKAAESKESKMASQSLDKFDNHFTMIGHREGPGVAEIHERMADVFVVVSGEAALVVGGQAQDSKTVSPGELRGSSIQGGERRKLEAGDIVHIPARMPHQLFIEPGKEFTYFVLKVETK